MKRTFLTDQDIPNVLSDPIKLSEDQKAQARENTGALGKSAVHNGYGAPTNPEAKFWVNPNGYVGNREPDTTYYDAFMSSVAGALSAFLSGTAKKYDTITEALAEGAGKTDGTGKVLGYTSGGMLNIMLLDNLECGERITVAKDCVIRLNGHKITFASGMRLDITSGKVTIDGTVPGSEITKIGENGATEILVMVKGQDGAEAYLVGGTYSLYGAGAYVAPIMAQDGALAKITMNGCRVVVNASGSTAVYGAYISDETAIDNCFFDVVNTTGQVSAIITRERNSAYALKVRNSTILAKGYDNIAAGISLSANTAILDGCKISAIAQTAGMDSSGIHGFGACQEISVTNCHIEADGHADINNDADGSGRRRANAIESFANTTTITINGGDYWGAREALSVHGTTRINGGIFKGCQHGGAYLSGEDIKVKNAIFRNVEYRGECGWDKPNPDGSKNWHAGSCYCGGNAVTPTNVRFDNCRFEAETYATHALVAKYDETTLYISNIILADNVGSQLRADKTDIIYVGKNVNGGEYTIYEETHGTVDSETYADQEFGFETETTADNAVLCVKDERGNWVGVC